jgi:CBS domain-containing protein
MRVNEIMTTNVVTVGDTSRVEDAARLLAHHRISGLPVVDQSGVLIGVVTEHDLIAKRGQTVADIMSRSVISVSPETEVEEVAVLLANRHVRRVPVLDGSQLVGIVSRSDLVQEIALRWVCQTCGEDLRNPEAPDECPRCGDVVGFIQDRELPRD